MNWSDYQIQINDLKTMIADIEAGNGQSVIAITDSSDRTAIFQRDPKESLPMLKKTLTDMVRKQAQNACPNVEARRRQGLVVH